MRGAPRSAAAGMLPQPALVDLQGVAGPERLWRKIGELAMQDLLWIGLIVGLLAVTLAYVRLCDNA